MVTNAPICRPMSRTLASVLPPCRLLSRPVPNAQTRSRMVATYPFSLPSCCEASTPKGSQCWCRLGGALWTNAMLPMSLSIRP